jgi:hypothetical protein
MWTVQRWMAEHSGVEQLRNELLAHGSRSLVLCMYLVDDSPYRPYPIPIAQYTQRVMPRPMVRPSAAYP